VIREHDPLCPDTVRLSEQAKYRLIRMKGLTGVRNWNVLCRWALALSLADPSPPLIKDVVTDSNVEMSWQTFSGPYSAIYLALLKQRCVDDGRPVTARAIAWTLKVHLHRGIGRMITDRGLHSPAGLANAALAGSPPPLSPALPEGAAYGQPDISAAQVLSPDSEQQR